MQGSDTPCCVAEYEILAKTILNETTKTYLDGIADNGVTYKDNIEAFKRYKFRPKLMRDVSHRSLHTTILGEPVDIPIGVAPFGLAKIFHCDGEIGLAKACKRKNTCYIQSCASHYSLEEVAIAEPACLRWQQFYVFKGRQSTLNLIRQSEKNGVKALVFTVDAPITRRKGLVMQFPDYIKFGNYEAMERDNHPPKSVGASIESRSSFTRTWSRLVKDPSITWNDLTWLKQRTKLPIVVKGILTGENAKKAIAYGADAITVSNHGGRYLDGTQATIDALEEVVDAVNGSVEVYFDGGIRSGTDVLKALSRGARATFIGRPAAWALASNGEEGVHHLLTLLQEELDISMALAGVTSVQNVDKDIVVHQILYFKARKCSLKITRRVDEHLQLTGDDYEILAKKILNESSKAYLDGIADDGITYRENIEAFKRYQFRPKVMRDVSNRSLRTTVLGESIGMPIGVAPFGLAKIFHSDGEFGLAKACKRKNTCFIQSCTSHYSLEEVAAVEPACLRWQQFYVFKDRQSTLNLIRQSEKNGVKALVFTVDTPIFRRKGLVSEFPDYIKLGNFEVIESDNDSPNSGGARSNSSSSFKRTWSRLVKDPSVTWDDLTWLKHRTKLPIVVKGILTGENAKKAIAYGADAIIVSNHGGRYLDGTQATIDALEEVVEAVNGSVEVYFDGGIRSGTDVLKALSRGARATFIGRPAAWALASNGEEGVHHILSLLQEELDISMALAGVTSVQNVDKDIVVHQSRFSNL